MTQVTQAASPTSTGGTHISLVDFMKKSRIHCCRMAGACARCDRYDVSMDVTTWDNQLFYVNIGHFYPKDCIYIVLRNLRYFYPDQPIRVAFQV